jgi:DNA-binding MarR family transcriptional regulator
MFDSDHHTPAGTRVIDLVDEAYRLRGRLQALGKILAAGTELSGLSQQIILSAAIRAKEPPTVARIARSLGYTRQAVRRVANELQATGHVRFDDNMHHARAKLLVPTRKGIDAYVRCNDANIEWTDKIGTALGQASVARATNVMRAVRQYLEREWLADVGAEDVGDDGIQPAHRSSRKKAGKKESA